MARIGNKVILNKDIAPDNIKNLILDIDNCVLDSTEWEKYIPVDDTREGWDNYHNHYYLVRENLDMKSFIYELCCRGLKNIYFITAREDINSMRKITEEQIESVFGSLRQWHKVNKYLYMRNTCDYSPTVEVKQNILYTHIFPHIFIDLAIDDDIRNVEMYRANGIEAIHYTKYSTFNN